MSATIPKLYKPAEVCEILRIKRTTLDSLIKTGKLRSVRVSPKHVRISEDALAEYLKEGEGTI